MILFRILEFVNDKFIFPIREQRLKQILTPPLKGVKSILDVGTGNGRIARLLQENLNVKVLGVDKQIQENVAISVKKYEGKRLPFNRDSFDCVLFVDVLHHDSNPTNLLSEAKRVSKKYVVIKDHYWESRLDVVLLKIADYIGNKPYGIALPYRFLNRKGWYRLIGESGLRMVNSSWFRDFALGIQYKQVLIKAEKPKRLN